MIRNFKYGLITLMILTLFSCNSGIKKSKRIANKVKTKVKQEVGKQVKRTIDKVYPPFDHDKPDTENNKKRFKDFIKIEITPDVSGIYCFDNAIGINSSYMVSFKCNPETSNKIIKTHGFILDKSKTSNGFGLQHDIEWWDKKRISQLNKYVWTDGRKFHKYYWYDTENGKAYFFDFDM